jgi:hypothetical protein
MKQDGQRNLVNFFADGQGGFLSFAGRCGIRSFGQNAKYLGFPLLAVKEGAEELYQDKLPHLSRLKYHESNADALADLEVPAGQVKEMFTYFQKYLSQKSNVA